MGYIFFFNIIIAFFSVVSFAQVPGSYPKTYLSAQENIYTGQNDFSFAGGSPGYGLKLTVLDEGQYFAPYFAADFSTINSSQNFLDSTTTVKANFVYYGSDADLGLFFFPIRRREKGFNVFVSGGGILGYNFISLNKNVTLNSIPYSDQAFSAGYTAGIGVELIFGQVDRKWSLLAEVEYKSSTAKLLNSTFSLNNGCFSIGVGW